MTPAHIHAWVYDMETRDLDPRRVATLTQRGQMRPRGYATATINQRLAGISSFYAYAERDYSVVLPDEREINLLFLSQMPSNPVRGVRRRDTDQHTAEHPYLNLVQLRQFFNAIPSSTAQGARDRALLMFYVMTGARNSQVRTLTWKDFEERDGRIFWRCRDVECHNTPDPAEWKELPPECWAAIECYLKAVGRWTTMEANTPIFTAMTMRARNLPGVDPEQWDPYRQPLTAREVNRLVKAYAVRAGLDGIEICTDTLRRSAVVLMESVGASAEDLRNFLNHRTKHATRIYLEKLGGGDNGMSTLAKWPQCCDCDVGERSADGTTLSCRASAYHSCSGCFLASSSTRRAAGGGLGRGGADRVGARSAGQRNPASSHGSDRERRRQYSGQRSGYASGPLAGPGRDRRRRVYRCVTLAVAPGAAYGGRLRARLATRP